MSDEGEPVRRDGRPSNLPRSETTIAKELRSEYERDVDRIKYNIYYRRLASITQVSSGQGKILRHNRLTHSEKVAQVGRRLAQYLLHESESSRSNRSADEIDRAERIKTGIQNAGGIDKNVVTAAGLLHDIGHPPFGHIAEDQLDKILRHSHHMDDGYEGNAQTLRILTSLTAHMSGASSTDGEDEGSLRYGLDLTHAVIAACVKYPWSSQEAREKGKRKWGFYNTEATYFDQYVRPLLTSRGSGVPSLEAEIMDWADDITYAVHDLQDFYTDDIIPLHHLRHRRGDKGGYEPVDYDEFADFWQYVTAKLRRTEKDVPSNSARRIFGEYASRFPARKFGGTRREIAKVGKLASDIITAASRATSVTEEGRLDVEPSMRSVIDALKHVTWYYVIDHPDLVSTQIGQRAKIDEMFGRLWKRVDFCFRTTDDSGRALSRDEMAALRRRLPVQLHEFVEQTIEENKLRRFYVDAKNRGIDVGKCYARAVADYIASMTEEDFEQLWERMCPGELYSRHDSRHGHDDAYPIGEGL